jgi:heme-degrading monooxygenase HmoA
MYACLTTIRLSAGMRASMEQRADRSAPLYRDMQGFRSVTYLIDETTNEYGSFSVWDSRADAEAAGATTRARMTQSVSASAQEPPVSRVFEIYEPTS